MSLNLSDTVHLCPNRVFVDIEGHAWTRFAEGFKAKVVENE
jgi:hypothetical protein